MLDQPLSRAGSQRDILGNRNSGSVQNREIASHCMLNML